jgi:3-oxoadipate enol-lactonase
MDQALRERVHRLARHALVCGTERQRTPQLDPPAFRRLAEIDAPTLVIVGDEDETFVQRVVDVLAERIRGARKMVFHNAAHMVNMERPNEVSAAVLSFLAEHPPS